MIKIKQTLFREDASVKISHTSQSERVDYTPKLKIVQSQADNTLLMINQMKFSMGLNYSIQQITPIKPTKKKVNNVAQSLQEIFESKNTRKRSIVVEDEYYYLKEFKLGKKAYFDEGTVQFCSESEYVEWGEHMDIQKQIEQHQNKKIKEYRNVLSRSQRTILNFQNPKLPSQEPMSEERYVHIPTQASMKKIQDQLDHSAKVKKKAEIFVLQKFNKSAFLPESLSKSLQLKPLKLPRKVVQNQVRKRNGGINNIDPFVNLINKQKELALTIKSNREYLKNDFKQIQRFLQSAL